MSTYDISERRILLRTTRAPTHSLRHADRAKNGVTPLGYFGPDIVSDAVPAEINDRDSESMDYKYS